MPASASLARNEFECPRTRERMLVSTVAFAEPISYAIAAVPELSYVAETIVWKLDRDGNLAGLASDPIRYHALESRGWYVGPVDRHARILARARRRGRGRPPAVSPWLPPHA